MDERDHQHDLPSSRSLEGFFEHDRWRDHSTTPPADFPIRTRARRAFCVRLFGQLVTITHRRNHREERAADGLDSFAEKVAAEACDTFSSTAGCGWTSRLRLEQGHDQEDRHGNAGNRGSRHRRPAGPERAKHATGAGEDHDHQDERRGVSPLKTQTDQGPDRVTPNPTSASPIVIYATITPQQLCASFVRASTLRFQWNASATA